MSEPFYASVLFNSTSDSLALVALYDQLTGSENWTKNDHWLTGPVSSWFGVTVSNGRVTRLDVT